MTSKARQPGERPPHVQPPAHLSVSPPLPAADMSDAPPEEGGRGGLDPVRYGDWESKGIAIDF